jgi:hypothetical protein
VQKKKTKERRTKMNTFFRRSLVDYWAFRFETFRRILPGVFLAVLGILAMHLSAPAATLTVANTNDDGPGSLREAIAEANANLQDDTIIFDPIIFSSSQTIVLTTGELRVLRDLNLPTGTVYSLSIVGPGSDLLTIDANNQSRILFSDYGVDIAINGLTLKHGFAVRGGAIYAKGDVDISNSVITENSAAGWTDEFGTHPEGSGGGIFAVGIVIHNSTLSNNTASGIVRTHGNPNIGDIGTSGRGGAVYSFGGQFVNCTFNNNIARGISSPTAGEGRTGAGGGFASGGAIFSEFSGTVINSRFIDNAALAGNGGSVVTVGVLPAGDGGGAEGGAIWSSGMRILNSAFGNNRATAGAGGVAPNPNWSGNGGNASGGAIFDRNLRIANATLTQNAVVGAGGRIGGKGSGGALFIGEAGWNLINLTVTNNSSAGGAGTQNNGDSRGGGIFSDFPDLTPGPSFRNNIAADNSATFGVDLFGFFPGAFNNLIRIGEGSTGVTNGTSGNLVGTAASPREPMLGPLADNGGVTLTRALLAGSPAINSGNNSANNPITSQPLELDQRNFQRIFPAGGAMDIGAYEFGSPSLPVTSSIPDLQSSSDTGTSSTDNITMSVAPTFDISKTIPGAKVELLRDNIVVATAYPVSFSTAVSDLSPPFDGTVQYTARQTIGGATSNVTGPLLVTFDHTAPTSTINQAVGQADPTRLLPINFTAVFSERVSSPGVISFQGSTANTAGAFLNNTSPDNITWNLAVSGITSNGSFLVVNIVAAGYQDLAGNPGAASTSTDNVVTLDNVRPSVTVNQAPAQPDPAVTQPLSFVVVFSEAVTGFTASDVSFSGSTANVSQAVVSVTGGPATYNVGIGNVLSSGLIRISIPTSAAQDVLGNLSFSSTSTDNTVTLTIRHARFDYDGDGKSDVSVFRPSTGLWYLLRSTAGYTGMQWGEGTDKITPADYDGDGKADVAVFRASNSTWYIFNSATQTFSTENWGQTGDLAVPADYDGDGKADVSVYRPSDANWYRKLSGGGFSFVNFGTAEDKPVPSDYDGDGKADIGVFRPSSGIWYFLRTTAGFTGIQWGVGTDIQAPGDYDGDGKTDVAVFRPENGTWYLGMSTLGFASVAWGQAGDIPSAGDFDGDGKTDVAVFRPSNGHWYILNSTAGIADYHFGESGDQPTESAFRY